MDKSKIRTFRKKLRRFDRLNELFNSTCCIGVTMAQCHALLEIEELGEATTNVLANNLLLDKSTLSRTVDSLVKLGLVKRKENSNDRRYITLVLSNKGVEKCNEINENNNIYPVLFFSHGANGNILTHSTLMEELESHGYIIFNIAHAYQTAFARDEKGHVNQYDRKHVDKVIGEATGEKIEKLKRNILSNNNLSQREKLYKDLIKLSPQTLKAVQMRSRDITSIINKLNYLDYSVNNFTSRIDTSKIGVLGFSLGGATAAQVCINDSRIKAGINIDGIMIGDFFNKNIAVPFMFITSE
jgi:DNA-binding MarR family transcriptional regulator